MTATAPTMPSLADAIDEAQYVWRTHCVVAGIFDADVMPWQHETTPDGTPMVTAQATGTEALILVKSLTGDGPFVLDKPGDQPPFLDVSVPGRVACVWRTGGVWVSLWAAEPAASAVPPSPDPECADVPF